MKKSLLSVLLALILVLLTACGGESPGDNGGGTTIDTDFAKDSEDMFDSSDFIAGDVTTEGSAEDRVSIVFSGDTASASSDSVIISGASVTLTEQATYVISGSSDNGMIIVDMDKGATPCLILDGLTLTSQTSAAIYIVKCDKAVVTLSSGTQSTLANGGEFVAIDDNNIDGVIWSKQDVTFNGNGSLAISSPAGHGITAKDSFVATSGTYNITTSSHGVDANDSIRVVNSVFTVTAGKDALHSENTDDAALGFVYIESGKMTLDAQGDGISAGAYIQIEGGEFNITAGGGSENGESHSSGDYGNFPGGGMGGRPRSSASTTASTEDSTSMKGIKSTGTLLINDGTFCIDSADDSIHSNTSVSVNGGTFEIESGDDGIHADDTLVITAGRITVLESYEGLEATCISIEGGDIKLTCTDDGINAAGGNDQSGFGGMHGDVFGGSSSSNGSISISGGTIYMNASGDGIDANGSLVISGGHVTVCGPTSGDTAVLDYDNSASITGGTFIGTGAYMMAQSFSDSSQGVLALTVGNQSAGSAITVTDAGGNVILEYTPALSYQIVIISTPEMVKGKEYTITVGSSSGTFEAQ